MQPQDYNALSDVSLMALCIWREARGESPDGQLGVGHVIQNRAKKGGWWGHDIHSVVLKPWQFSSFNAGDPNSTRWPDDESGSWTNCLSAATAVIVGKVADITNGATHYFDVSIPWPKAWGQESEYENTLNIGRLRFYKLLPPSNHQAVAEAAAEG